MPGIKIKLSTEEARAASERLQKTLKSLGAEVVLTEKAVKDLEKRMLDRMQADNAKKSLEQLAQATGLTSKEVSNLKTKLGEHLTVLERVKAGYASLKTNWMAVTGALVAGYMAVHKAVKYLEMGVEAEQAEQTFKSITDSMGVNAEELAVRMKRASRGMIDESSMMQKAIFALDQEVDPNKIPELFEAARVASRKTGQDIVSTTDGIIDAVGAGIPRALRRMGLLTKEQMAMFNRAMAMGIDDVKLFDLVLANAAVSSARFNMEQSNSREKMAQFKAAFKDLQEAVGQQGWKFIERGEAAFLGLAGGITGALAAMKRMRAEGYEKMAKEAKTPAERSYYEMKAEELRQEQQNWQDKAQKYGKAYFDYIGVKQPSSPGARRTKIRTPEGEIKEVEVSPTVKKNLQEANKLRAALNKQAEEEQRQQDLINEGARTKAHAEAIKERNAAEMAASEDSAKTRLDILRNYTNVESQLARAELDEREALNTEFYNARKKEIAAEYDSRMVGDKNFKHWAKDWLGIQYQILDAQMEARDVQEQNARLRIEELRTQEKLNEKQREAHHLYNSAEAARKRMIDRRVTTLQYEQRARDAEIDHEARMTGLRGRYGEAPREREVSNQYDVQTNKLLSESLRIRETITEKDEKIQVYHEDYNEWLKERFELELQLEQIEKDMAHLEKERNVAMREFADDFIMSIDGLKTGFRVYRNQLGSEFQIWEQMAKDTAQAMQQSFSDFFFDVLTGKCKSFEDYWKTFAQGLSRALADAFAKKTMNTILDIGGDSGLSGWLSTGLSFLGIGGPSMGGAMIPSASNQGAMQDFFSSDAMAKGNVLDRGRVIAFEKGDIVNQPTFFPMAKGMGLMGEAGPEAVMPLTRSSSGHLGVRAIGGGASTIQGATFNMPMTVIGMSKKMASEVRQAAEEAVERKIKEYV